jgi:hypothetical protein
MVTGQCRFNCIGGVIVKVLASSAVDREFESRSGQTNDYNNFFNEMMKWSALC